MLKRLRSTTFSEFIDTGISLLVLRVFASLFMFYGHGLGKLTNVLNGNMEFLDPIGLGPGLSLILSAFAEGICTLFIIAGYYSRAAAFILMLNMSVAFLFVHLTQSFDRMELSLVYLLIFTTVFLLGPGKYSLDGRAKTA